MQLPGPVRAVVGLVAVAAEEAKHLPDRAIELPMLAVSTALQMSLRAQQRYARLAARGDDVLNRRPPSEEPPAWATFDDPLPPAGLRAAGLDDADPAVRARAASKLLDELLGVPEDGPEDVPEDVPEDGPEDAARPAERAAARKAAQADQPAKPKQAARAAKKPAAKKASPAKKAAKGSGTGKSISPPRNSPPSRFDTVDE